MNKAELIREIAFKADLTQKDAGLAFNAMVEIIAQTLKKGENIRTQRQKRQAWNKSENGRKSKYRKS